jgi:hypothetical protein
MIIMQFFHYEKELLIEEKVFKADCDVRNEINDRRKSHQIVKTFPRSAPGDRQAYMPRKFPTGIWQVKKPVWTDNPEYWPVKIPTDAVRQVMTWDVKRGVYTGPTGTVQDDSFYHLHFARDSITTLGCIRLDSEQDAREIASFVEEKLKAGEDVWLEVFANKE